LQAPHWIGEQMAGAVVPQAKVGARLVQQPDPAAVAQATSDKISNLRIVEPFATIAGNSAACCGQATIHHGSRCANAPRRNSATLQNDECRNSNV
jgi:hypothetical protein